MPEHGATDGLEDATEILPRAAGYSPQPAEVVDRRIADYIVEGVIGEGGGGTVFSGRHQTLGHRAAIKLLRPEMVPMPALVTRFNREVEAINKIRHPNIVRVLECGELGLGQPYYVMELLEGMNLRRLLQLHGRFTPPETLELLAPICKALQAVHDAGFVHRDVKCSNVQVADMNGERVVKLLDFGIAKLVHGENAGEGLTEPGARLGSAHNMAPEQVRCERLDARADIYALGVVIFQLLTGQYPFHAEDPRQIALMHLQMPAPRPSAHAPLLPAIDAVVLRCLEKSADRRFASAEELLASFQAAVGQPAPALAAQELRAAGVLVEVVTPDAGELDDALIEDLSNVLDSAERWLLERGFGFPLRTAQALLGVLIPEGELAQREASATAAALRTLLLERPDPHPDLQLRFSVRVDVVRGRPAATGHELLGGSLLDLSSWTDAHRLDG